MGHECVGVVVSVGPDVTHLAVGDRVAIEPGVSCGQCPIHLQEGTVQPLPTRNSSAPP
jgi:threonine dehydrogenase-like Zn-dependent dehydrogenase